MLFGMPQDYAKLVRHIIENDMLNGEVIRLDGRLAPKWIAAQRAPEGAAW